MDYSQKLPVAGGAVTVAAVSTTHQWWLIGGTVVLVGLIAFLIRWLWRRNKKLNDK